MAAIVFVPFYYKLTQQEKIEYFNKLGERLLEHRYRYYILHDPVLKDWEYDELERYYEAVASDLELAPIASDMVDFDEKRVDAQAAKARVDSGTDNYSLWMKEMEPVWERLGPPAKQQKEEQLKKKLPQDS